MGHTIISSDKEAAETAANIILMGGLVVLPTDTTYGIACDAQNEQAIQNLKVLKGREDDRFTLIAASQEQVQKYFHLSPKQSLVASQQWPGPVSIVVNDRFSVRVPRNVLCIAIAEAVGHPIIATSANKTGEKTPLTIGEVKEQLGEDMIELWIDGGALLEQQPSVVVRVTTTGVEVLREGLVSIFE